jgi:hypothetical protein
MNPGTVRARAPRAAPWRRTPRVEREPEYPGRCRAGQYSIAACAPRARSRAWPARRGARCASLPRSPGGRRAWRAPAALLRPATVRPGPAARARPRAPRLRAPESGPRRQRPAVRDPARAARPPRHGGAAAANSPPPLLRRARPQLTAAHGGHRPRAGGDHRSARGPPLWEAADAEHDPAADPLLQCAPAFTFDQRLSW